MLEGAEGDFGSGEGPGGAREDPGPNSVEGYARRHEHLQCQRKPSRYLHRSSRSSQTDAYGFSREPIQWVSSRYNNTSHLLVFEKFLE